MFLSESGRVSIRGRDHRLHRLRDLVQRPGGTKGSEQLDQKEGPPFGLARQPLHELWVEGDVHGGREG